jgi:hypothetical protein
MYVTRKFNFPISKMVDLIASWGIAIFKKNIRMEGKASGV